MNILYHSGCDDGFGAAYVFWKHFNKQQLNFVPVSYPATLSDQQIEGFRDQDVVVVDFCFDVETTDKLYDVATSLVILDHHSDPAFSNMVRFIFQRFNTIPASNNSIYYANDRFKIVFDPSLSGAMLAWNYLNPTIPPPKAIQHIMEADLWKFQFQTKKFKSYLQSFDQNFEVWDSIIEEYEIDPYKILDQGDAILRRYDADVDYIMKHQSPSLITLYDGIARPALALNTTKKYASTVATNLCKVVNPNTGLPYEYGCAYLFSGDKAIISLRCLNGFRVDTLASQYNGGGHEKASGFVMNAIDFSNLIFKP